MKIVCGNWKMNQSVAEVEKFFSDFKAANVDIKCGAWIAPQFIHLQSLIQKYPQVQFGSQNSSEFDSGAYTGEVSPVSLKDIGASFVIIGHSERRAIYKETDATLNLKTKNALKSNLKVIFCVGETLEEREADKTFSVIKTQLDLGLQGIEKKADVIIAYEPVWAIGTGKTASPAQAEEVHQFIRNHITEKLGFNAVTPILYGGSVKPDNFKELLSQKNIDGGLVGGASLKGQDFAKLVEIASH